MSRELLWLRAVLGVVLLLAFFSLLSLLPMEFLMLAGMPLTFAIPAAGWVLYRRHSRGATPGEDALNFGLMANGVAVGFTMLVFLSVPTGVYGRPMMLPMLYLGYGLATMVAGLGKVKEAWRRERPLAASALILCLSIFPVELLTVLAVAFTKAYEFEP